MAGMYIAATYRRANHAINLLSFAKTLLAAVYPVRATLQVLNLIQSITGLLTLCFTPVPNVKTDLVRQMHQEERKRENESIKDIPHVVEHPHKVLARKPTASGMHFVEIAFPVIHQKFVYHVVRQELKSRRIEKSRLLECFYTLYL